MTPRVAFVRGEALNPYEFQSYAPLSAHYDMVAIGATDGAYACDDLGAPVVLLRPAARTRLGRRLLGDRSRRLRGLSRAVADADIVHAAETFLPVSEQAAELREARRFRLVVTCWETIPFLHEDLPEVATRKRVVRGAVDRFVAVTEAARDALLHENVSPERILVQPMGVDRKVFRPAERAEAVLREWAVPDDAFVILFSGRLVREKGVLDLVLALERVPDAFLVVVGEGPERPRLEAAALARGVAPRVRFAGRRRYGEMPQLYASADVLCLPSVPTPYWEEQFGMVLAEAMACGLPIVATESGAIPEVVGDAAVLVPPLAPAELARALTHLAGDAEARELLRAAGLQRAAERFDAAVVAARLRDAYGDLLR